MFATSPLVMRLMNSIRLILWSIHQDHLHLNTRYICSYSVLCHLTQTHKNFWFSLCFPHEHKNFLLLLLLTQIQANTKEREILSTPYIFLPSHTIIISFPLLLSNTWKLWQHRRGCTSSRHCTATWQSQAQLGWYHKPKEKQGQCICMLGNEQNIGRRK